MTQAIDSVGSITVVHTAAKARTAKPVVVQTGPEKVPAGNGKNLPGQSSGDAANPAVQSDQIEKAVSKLNDFVQNIRRDLHFTVDDSTGRTVIKVVDSESEEVIRQIPSEEALALARHLGHVADGAIFREKA